MAGPVLIIDSSDILGGKLGEARAAIRSLTKFVEENEPRVLSYTVYLDAAGTRMTVVQLHPDSASLERHLDEAAAVFRQFKGLIRMTSMDVYGRPSDTLLERLRRKALVLGNADVTVHRAHAGFTRPWAP